MSQRSSRGQGRMHLAHYRILVLLVVACPLLMNSPAEAEIRWRATDATELPLMTPQQTSEAIAALTTLEGPEHIIVSFSEPITAQVRKQMRDAGVELLTFLGDNTFMAGVSQARLRAEALAAIATLQSALQIPAQAKLHAFFANQTVPAYAIVGQTQREDSGEFEDIVAAYVLFHRDVDLQSGILLAQKHNAFVRDQIGLVNGLVIELPLSQVANLAAEDSVLWIEPPMPMLEAVNDSNRAAIQAGIAQDPPYGLDGTGVSVMVFDAGTGLESHADFGGRLMARDLSGTGDHATHTAGTIGGDGTVSNPPGTRRGMAPNVTIQAYGFEWSGGIFLYENPGDIIKDYGDAINNYGAVLANNSIGTNTATNGFPCSITGDYGVTSSVIDSIVIGDLGAPIRIVWANGNERQTANCGNLFHTTAPPACAKNHLTVGAMNSNDDSVTSFTSWGPCDDGRLKPDLSAPGCQSNGDGGVTSTSASGGYSTKCGTSMACPTVVGAGALLLQDFREQFEALPDFAPSMMKVLMAHTAKDLENTGPDYKTGYGLVQIKDAIDFMRTAQFTEQELEQGTVHAFSVVVASGTEELKFTLAWDDVPGTPLVIPSLVNDLDIRAISPGGQPHFPWTLNPDNPGAPAVRTQADHVNNIEQVVVDNPEPGEWIVEVSGFVVPEGPQLYSLAGSPNLDVLLVVFSYPQGLPDMVEPNTPYPLQAQLQAIGGDISEAIVRLHHSVDGGPVTDVVMDALGDDLYQADLPAADCLATINFYISVEVPDKQTFNDPSGAPDSTYQTVSAEGILTTFSDAVEGDTSDWTITSDASLVTGEWEQAEPNGTVFGGDPAAPDEDTTSGDGNVMAFVTQNCEGAGCDNAWESDLDGGPTMLTSPIFHANMLDTTVTYSRWFYTSSNDGVDMLITQVSNDGGDTWTEVDNTTGTDSAWESAGFVISDFISQTSQMRVRFIALDAGTNSIVEAAIDDFAVTQVGCESISCGADIDCSGAVGAADLAALLASWGPCPPEGDCLADLDGDGQVGASDLAQLLAAWG